MNQELRDTLRIAELDVGIHLRSWRSRIEAVNAEIFDVDDAGLVVGHVIKAAVSPQTNREKRRWMQAAAKLLLACWWQIGPRSAIARGVLLALADRADAKQIREEV